ncbi:FRG domain-containing protein [Brachybacterium sp. AOP43-C2-M15]|uniref:FRG domain-containing protein n=1 Tax=Brachybacterium sp. AOP43-C2-M15 TaxID=3457661 RepID=UPI0040341F9D
MSSPGAYFQEREILIESFEGLNRAIVALISKAESLQLVWRGQQDASWAMNSSLFRRLKASNKVKDPGPRVRGAQPFPTEDQMVSAETEILRVAREDWRLDGLSALETFARIQHAGGTSRLIDVTKNPFIGAWFACEESPDTDNKDARLFAFATTPPLADGRTIPGVQISLDRDWSGHLPPWHLWDDSEKRRDFDWGTGSRRRLWVPPNYDSRIAAQNAAFLIDGVPLPTKSASYFPSPSGYWTHADILAAGSIYMKTAHPARKPRSNMHNFAPTFTFRITASAKLEIRSILTERFGYTTSYIYPDVAKLAEWVNSMELPGREAML